MSLPEGKAIYLIAFITFLSYIRKLTDLCVIIVVFVFIC